LAKFLSEMATQVQPVFPIGSSAFSASDTDVVFAEHRIDAFEHCVDADLFS
jgi:hypothetical protein